MAVFVVDEWRRSPVRNLEIARDGYFAPDALPSTATPGTRRRIADFVTRRGGSGPW
jgi:hypothetical protein